MTQAIDDIADFITVEFEAGTEMAVILEKIKIGPAPHAIDSEKGFSRLLRRLGPDIGEALVKAILDQCVADGEVIKCDDDGRYVSVETLTETPKGSG